MVKRLREGDGRLALEVLKVLGALRAPDRDPAKDELDKLVAALLPPIQVGIINVPAEVDDTPGSHDSDAINVEVKPSDAGDSAPVQPAPECPASPWISPEKAAVRAAECEQAAVRERLEKRRKKEAEEAAKRQLKA